MNPPPGFRYRDDALTPDEERGYAERFRTLPLKPFEFRNYLGKRRVLSFGWRYDYTGRRVRESAPLPDFLLPLRERAGELSGVAADTLQQALVTEYEPGAPIGWHRDKPEFGEVLAFSFLSPARLRLRRREGTGWQRWAIEVQPRSLYVLSGPARQEWEHSIPPLEALRYSVTFRTFLGERGRDAR
jgi:alkylated DNA repair dioxygenase AlkB